MHAAEEPFNKKKYNTVSGLKPEHGETQPGNPALRIN